MQIQRFSVSLMSNHCFSSVSLTINPSVNISLQVASFFLGFWVEFLSLSFRNLPHYSCKLSSCFLSLGSQPWALWFPQESVFPFTLYIFELPSSAFWYFSKQKLMFLLLNKSYSIWPHPLCSLSGWFGYFNSSPKSEGFSEASRWFFFRFWCGTTSLCSLHLWFFQAHSLISSPSPSRTWDVGVNPMAVLSFSPICAFVLCSLKQIIAGSHVSDVLLPLFVFFILDFGFNTD